MIVLGGISFFGYRFCRRNYAAATQVGFLFNIFFIFLKIFLNIFFLHFLFCDD